MVLSSLFLSLWLAAGMIDRAAPPLDMVAGEPPVTIWSNAPLPPTPLGALYLLGNIPATNFNRKRGIRAQHAAAPLLTSAVLAFKFPEN